MLSHILCLRVQNLNPAKLSALVESCTALSPQILHRYDEANHEAWIFIDIGLSLRFFGDVMFWQRFQEIINKSYFQAAWAVHRTPAQAQVLAASGGQTANGLIMRDLLSLPVSLMAWVEGLKPWDESDRRTLKILIQHLHDLGVRTFDAFLKFPGVSIGRRWGELGYRLKQKLLGFWTEAIPVFLVAEPLEEKKVFDFSPTHKQAFEAEMDPVFQKLLLRLESLGLAAIRVELIFQHEYSQKVTTLNIRSARPTTTWNSWKRLTKHELESLELDNPIRQVTLKAEAVSADFQQYGFWNETEGASKEAMLDLVSRLSQSIGPEKVGFAHLKDSHLPHKEWELHQAWPSSALAQWPQSLRPTRLFKVPQPISEHRIQWISPWSERIWSHWWDSKDYLKREYFVARLKTAPAAANPLVWIFAESHRLFLHGFFD